MKEAISPAGVCQPYLKKRVDLGKESAIFAKLEMKHWNKKTIRFTTTVTRLVAVTVITVLTIPDSSAVGRLWSPDGIATSQSEAALENREWIPARFLSDSDQENLATNGRPGGGQSVAFLLAPVLKPDNSEKRLKKQGIFKRPTVVFSDRQVRQREVLTSTSLISSDLGQLLTLVGSKPSGTG
ncbi:MAG: hypothetical protein ABII79_07845 [bacterium]